MARARNIKPSFFDNDELAENDPLGRLLFIGMWTICDYRGNFVWREKRIKARLLPFDNCDIKELAINLDRYGFIRFYSDGEEMYCSVPTFVDHQNPHKNEREKGSDIPLFTEEMAQAVDLKGLTINPDNSGRTPDKNGSPPAESLIPITDSLLLNPDSLEDPSTQKPKPPKVKNYVFDDRHSSLATQMATITRFRFPDLDINMDAWSDAVRKLVELDKRTALEIEALWRWIARHDNDGFSWADQILSPMKLRKKKQGLRYLEKLEGQMLREPNNGNRSGENSSQARKPSLVERVKANNVRRQQERGVSQGTGDTFDGEVVGKTIKPLRP